MRIFNVIRASDYDHISKLIQTRNATATITSISGNGTADVDFTLQSAFTNNPQSYVLQNTGSTTLYPIALRSWTDTTHPNIRVYNCSSSASSNVSITLRIIGISVTNNT